MTPSLFFYFFILHVYMVIPPPLYSSTTFNLLHVKSNWPFQMFFQEIFFLFFMQNELSSPPPLPLNKGIWIAIFKLCISIKPSLSMYFMGNNKSSLSRVFLQLSWKSNKMLDTCSILNDSSGVLNLFVILICLKKPILQCLYEHIIW